MKKQTIIVLLSLFTSLQLSAQSDLWRVGTAYTLPKYWFSGGIFQPLQYGLTKKTELSTYLLGNIYIPNLSLKHRWYVTPNNILISSNHGVYYASMALNKLNGSKWLQIPLGESTPFVLPMYHEILASKFLKPKTSCDLPDYLLTVRIGIKFSIGKLTPATTMAETAPFFQRTQPYFGKILWYVGADLEAHLTEFLNYSVDLDFLSVGAVKNFALEHKGLIVWPIDKRWTMAGGYMAHFGTTTNSSRIFLMPLFDLSYKFTLRHKTNQGLDLFGTDIFKYDDNLKDDSEIDDHLYDEYYDEDQKPKKESEEKP
jgi:hypothetical protein